MKKLLLSLSAIAFLALTSVKAQTIPNAGFETWTPNLLVPTANDPNTGDGSTGWWDFNVDNSSILGSSPITVFEGSTNPSPEQGSHYAAIVSETMTATTYDDLKKYGFAYPRTNGLMFLGNVDAITQSFKTGIPCNNHLQSFSFYYRYIPNGSDSMSCTIAMYHWNSAAKMRTLLGGGYWGTNVKQTVWTSWTVPIFYNPDSIAVTPDTLFILFSASTLDSNNSPKAGDTLDIDNSSVVTAINNLASENANVHVYPNPANNQINLAVSSPIQASRVEVYDITGKLMGTYAMHNNLLTINTQQYSTGLYLYKMYDNAGVQINIGKFSVVK